jgi:hypothetical protein
MGDLEWIDKGLRINYDSLLKCSSSLQLEPANYDGTTLIITDDYSGIQEAQRRQRLDEVDHSLRQWGRDLSSYLQLWHRWSWMPLWRWYMQRIWQPTKPSARCITRLIVWVSLAEMALVLLLIAVLVIEQ